MRQKNYKWIYYILIIAILGAVIYIATKNIAPVSRHVEQNIVIDYNK